MTWLILMIAYLTLLSLVLQTAFTIYHQYTYWKRRGIPHLKLVPIIGNNLPIFLRKVSIPNHSQNLYQEFPGAKYFGMFDFKTPALFIKDPELINEVCVKNFDNFIDHDVFVTEEMDPTVGRNLFSLKGQRWRDMRNTLSPSFSSSRMKFLFQMVSKCAKEFTEYFVNHPEETKDVEMRDAFTRYASDVIATSAFGIQVNSMADKDNEFYLHGKATVSFTPLWIIKYELLRYLPKMMHAIGMTFLPKSTDGFFKQLILETVKMRQEKGTVRPDMIHLMMRAISDKDNSFNITVDDIIAQAFVFFLAGFDTSAAFMSFLAHELAANLDVQEKLHREVDQEFEDADEDVSYESLSEIKYLDMVINEALRLYPPASILSRVCDKDIDLPPPMKGYPMCHVDKGTTVMLSLYGLHRDPKYFPRPNKFDPERFNAENKNKILPYTYIPFGAGPRKCIASRFALMEVKVVMINLLRKFAIRFTNKTQHPIVFDKKTFIMFAEGGVWLKLEERKKKQITLKKYANTFKREM